MAGLAMPLVLASLLWLLGWIFGLPYWGLVVALIGVVIWQHAQQLSLIKWVRKGAKDDPPEIFAPLDEVVSLLLKRHRQSRKRKRKLQEMLKYYHELAKAIPDAAMVVDKSGRLLNFNHAARTLLGLDSSRDQGTRLDHLIRGESFSRFWQTAEHKTATVRLPGDAAVYVELIRVPLSGDKILLIARNVTDLVLLDQKRKAFVDNASHELKTPLTVISGFLEIMAEHEDLSPSLHIPVTEMRHHARRMQALVCDMLQLANLEQHHLVLKESIIDVTALFKELCTTAAQRFPDSVGVYCHDIAPLAIMADEQMLFSALNNLVANALLHANSRHAVELKAMVTDYGVVLSVHDDGIGMAAEHLPRITERFYRIDDQRDNSVGSGLGLAIVRHAAEAHGATLEVTSEPNVGSVFGIVLPLARLVTPPVVASIDGGI